MKYLNKFKNNFVINTNHIEKSDFNSPVYIINSGKDFIETYSRVKLSPKSKNTKVIKNKIDFKAPLNEKTFISVKDFFKKCKLESTEYKIEKVNNGNIFILVASFGELGLFFKTNPVQNHLFLTNMNCYKFQKTSNNTREALLNATHLNEFEQMKIANYLSSKKNLKRDFIFILKKSLDSLQAEYQSTQKPTQK